MKKEEQLEQIENKEVEEKIIYKTKGGVKALVVILIMAVVGLSTYIATTFLIKDVTPKTLPKKEEGVNEIKDIDTLTELATKIDMILGGRKTTKYETQVESGMFGYNFGALKNELSAKDKQLIVLENVEGWESFTKDNWKSSAIADIIESDLQYGASEDEALKEHSYISETKVNEFSKKMFGSTITKPEKIESCPSYFYDAKNKNYNRPSPRCGGTSPDSVKSYKSKFEEEGNEAHVYVSFAYLVLSGTNSVLDTYTVYKDFDILDKSLGKVEYKEKYKEKVTSPDLFILDKKNYQDFSEYKFTFKKANNNYHFVKVEQTK